MHQIKFKKPSYTTLYIAASVYLSLSISGYRKPVTTNQKHNFIVNKVPHTLCDTHAHKNYHYQRARGSPIPSLFKIKFL